MKVKDLRQVFSQWVNIYVDYHYIGEIFLDDKVVNEYDDYIVEKLEYYHNESEIYTNFDLIIRKV